MAHDTTALKDRLEALLDKIDLYTGWAEQTFDSATERELRSKATEVTGLLSKVKTADPETAQDYFILSMEVSEIESYYSRLKQIRSLFKRGDF